MAVSGPGYSDQGALYGHHARAVDEIAADAISAGGAFAAAFTSVQNCLLRVFVHADTAGNVYVREDNTRNITLGAIPANELREFLVPISANKTYAVHLSAGASAGARCWADVVNA